MAAGSWADRRPLWRLGEAKQVLGNAQPLGDSYGANR